MTHTDVAAHDDYLDLLKKCLTAALYDESAWRIEDGYRSGRSGLFYRLRLSFYRMLARRGYRVVKALPFDAARRHDGADWPMFGYSMVGTKRLDNLERCLRSILADQVPGDLLETGVWRGGACIFMKAMLNRFGDKSRTVWLADSFQGLPKPTAAADQEKRYDLADCDFMKVSQEQVQANFERFGLLDDRVRFLKGWFCDTLPTAPIKQLALLRLDGDLYDSTRDALKAMYYRVAPGGFIVVDDYGSWNGCRVAVDEFRKQFGIESPMNKIDFTGVYWRVAAHEAHRAAA